MAFLVPLAATAAAGAGTAAAAGGTLATIGTIASVASAGLGALGAIQQGKAASQAAAYNAKVAENNAKIALQNRDMAAAEGNVNVEAKQMENRQRMASLKASQAASGIDITSGSALDVQESTAKLGERDALNIRANAARQAYGYETQAANATAQSQLDKAEGKSASVAGYLGAGKTLLGSVGDNWDKFTTSKSSFSTRDIIPSDIAPFQ